CHQIKRIKFSAHTAPYEFGVKASIVTTNARAPGGQFVLHAKALPGNPYDGHTLGAVIEATERLTGREIERARLLDGLTIGVGNRKNRILLYQFLAAEIRALHYSYGVGDGESYQRALMFLEKCERLRLRSLIRNSAQRHVEVTVAVPRGFFCAP